MKQTGVTGVTGTSSQQLRTRRDLQLFSERYTQEFTQGTSVSLTYHPIYIIAKRKSMKQNVYFVSGIDTDAGKSYATGFLAREWNKNGQRTITQKFIQTGNVGHSEDIDLHRHIMGIPFTEEDKEGLTMPEIFSILPLHTSLPNWITVPLTSVKSNVLRKN